MSHRATRTVGAMLLALMGVLVVGARTSEVAASSLGTIYVANDGATPSITEYSVGASGNATPSATISGSLTGLTVPVGVAVDSSGTLYVANSTVGTITEYSAGANGNIAPIRTITGLDVPYALAFDESGDLYVANQGTGSSDAGSVAEYAPGAHGAATPTATIAGGSTGIDRPVGLAFDGTGTLYVNNYGSNVTEYTSGVSGAPVRTITSTDLDGGTFLMAVDAAGTSYIANPGGPPANSIIEFPYLASGSVTPVVLGSGGATDLDFPRAVGLDASGNLYATNTSSDEITEYAPGANGLAAPISTIVGGGTGLEAPFGITIDYPTTTTVTSSQNPQAVGQAVHYTATVAPTPNGGTVAFSDAGTPITGCAAVAVSGGTATCTVTYSSAATHTVTATYEGNSEFQSSVSAGLTQAVTAVPVPESGAVGTGGRGSPLGATLAVGLTLLLAGVGLLGWERRRWSGHRHPG